jgi:hypothetical protein
VPSSDVDPAATARGSRASSSSAITRTAFSPLGYMISTRTDRYAVDLRIPRSAVSGPGGSPPTWRAGDRIVSLRRNVARVVMSAAERRDRETYLKAMTSGSRAGSASTVPQTKPPIRNVLVGADGRVWVLISVASERYSPRPAERSSAPTPVLAWREPVVFDVFEPNGAYVGQVGVPDGAVLSYMRGDVTWGVLRGADGLETVKRWRIEWGK